MSELNFDHAELGVAGFGNPVAECEANTLPAYFYSSRIWQKLLDGELDIVYGAAGAGKSALMIMLESRAQHLARRGILAADSMITANPIRKYLSGAHYLPGNQLWSLHIGLSVAAGIVSASETREQVLNVLSKYQLISKTAEESLSAWPRLVAHRRSLGTLLLSLIEPRATSLIVTEERGKAFMHDVFDIVGPGIGRQYKTVWIPVDPQRLYGALFAPDAMALASLELLRLYLDLQEYRGIELKVVLSEDLWERPGIVFREASHIVRAGEITWDEASLGRMLELRILLGSGYAHEAPGGMVDDGGRGTLHSEVFDAVFPRRLGLAGVLNRIRDGTRRLNPRLVLEVLSLAWAVEYEKLSPRSDIPARSAPLSARSVLQAIGDTAELRLYRLLAEADSAVKRCIVLLLETRSALSITELADLWDLSPRRTSSYVDQLRRLGIVEEMRAGGDASFRVAALYRATVLSTKRTSTAVRHEG